ncbi:ATP-binding protein [Aminobacter sp. MET-1]|uniref:ATP-binding protein n=1 Tax=Aminobacter sp. MET-1 TaxID=2951085 RepID=UPI00226A9AC1|nr:ATP-binding protein [Aminobacter sp. MET-1]MCX8568801.1 ATP-binding protein [Aminobacter sp. MET-1]
MNIVSVKREVSPIDGTPLKRVFMSIISDYDLKTGLCELVDNAVDLWTANGKPKGITVRIRLDSARQLISVEDNAGGVQQQDLHLLVAPGASHHSSDDNVIGVFGVGSKRAAVALGERVEIRTRYKKQKSFQLDLTPEWLASEDWEMPVYEIAEIAQGTTRIDISHLRQTFTDDDVENIKAHVSGTYASFIEQGCSIEVEGEQAKPARFNNWAYPPGYAPRSTSFEVSPNGKDKIAITTTAGLILDRSPAEDNYGVYFYCNGRLIVKELKSWEVGYVTGSAGIPHPDASLCRVIVEMSGPPEIMPWNSSKSGINYSNPVFKQIRPTILNLVTYFSMLSRRMKNDRDEGVFAYPQGTIESIDPQAIGKSRLVLPILPAGKRRHADTLKIKNKNVISSSPWTLGLVEAMGLVDIISRQKLETKNRAALILLDSNFEISMKEFIVNRTDLFPVHIYNDTKILEIFKSRHKVINEVAPHIPKLATLMPKINHMYTLRNKLVHERATVGITDTQISDFRQVVGQALKLLFDIKIS